MKDIFNESVTSEIIERINKLSPSSQPHWGKMSVANMLAHCNVTYEMAFETLHKKPNGIVRFLMKLWIKKFVVNEVPFKKNIKTAPQFIIKDTRNFEAEKKRLIDYILQTQQLGPSYFEGKESHSFGPLTEKEWSNMFYKHLDHHLTQFGV